MNLIHRAVYRIEIYNMGQGRWIRKSDGHYKHYTEEEYRNSPEGIAEKWNNNLKAIIMVGFVALVIIGLIIKALTSIWQWLVGLF